MPSRSCVTCRKTQSELPTLLETCGRCQNPYYCSKECQSTDWKLHKPSCNAYTGSNRFVPLNSHSRPSKSRARAPLLSLGIPQPLYNIPQADVFCFLVDCFRLRVDDEYVFQGHWMGSMNPMGRSACILDFAVFLNIAESRSGFLPDWWTPNKRRLCEEYSVRTMFWEYKYHGHSEGNITQPTNQAAIQEHYKDMMMSMKLRSLAETVYGVGIV